MKNANVFRTATVATLAAFVIATGLMSSPEESMEVAAAPSPTYHFPAAYQLQPGADDAEVFEYY